MLQASQLNEYDNHEFVMRLHDKPSGLEAFIAVHNTNLGAALGGTRMLAYDSENEALRDVLNLSRAMTFKCALAGLPYGGGKAVIMIDETKNRDAVLFAYGRMVEKLRGLFKTGTDVGVSDEDVRKMASHTEHMIGISQADRGELTTSSVAALGVFHAIQATMQHLPGGRSLAHATVAVKGVGKLGGELVRLLLEAGAVVCIADSDDRKCQQLKRQFPEVQVVPVSEIRRQEVTIYAPCALGNELTAETLQELRCEAVVGGANNQLAAPEIGDILFQKGMLYAPDYVANAGGLIYVADELEAGGFDRQRVLQRTRAIGRTIDEIFHRSAAENKPTSRVADEIAADRLQRGPAGEPTGV